MLLLSGNGGIANAASAFPLTDQTEQLLYNKIAKIILTVPEKSLAICERRRYDNTSVCAAHCDVATHAQTLADQTSSPDLVSWLTAEYLEHQLPIAGHGIISQMV